jgi:hypothetical protein
MCPAAQVSARVGTCLRQVTSSKPASSCSLVRPATWSDICAPLDPRCASEILTPSFMMLDSIRKASGAERDDVVRAEHIYSYLRRLERWRQRAVRAGHANSQL